MKQKRIQKLFPRLAANKKLVFSKRSYLHTTGWIESIKRGYPCSPTGEPLPWMNYPVIAFLENRLNTTQRMFEYGSGYSTLFYADRVQAVSSVEHDEGWQEHLSKKLPGNARVLFREQDVDGDYCRSIGEDGDKYDVVVIDGRDRVNCLKQCLPHLSEQGVVLLDDSQRSKYAEALTHARAQGFRQISFEGLKPGKNSLDRTTVFYRDGSCFRI